MSKKMKKFGVQPVGRPASDINVTPLVDVVLVLLIIFMVVTPLLEKDIEVRVPEQEQTEEPPPPDDQTQLVVSIDKQGNVKLNNQQIAWNDYLDKMKKVIAAKNPGEKIVFFTPDDGANYGAVVKALDGAKAAGAETLGMVTEPVAAAAPGAAPGGAPTPPAPPAPPATP